VCVCVCVCWLVLVGACVYVCCCVVVQLSLSLQLCLSLSLCLCLSASLPLCGSRVWYSMLMRACVCALLSVCSCVRVCVCVHVQIHNVCRINRVTGQTTEVGEAGAIIECTAQYLTAQTWRQRALLCPTGIEEFEMSKPREGAVLSKKSHRPLRAVEILFLRPLIVS